MMDIQPRRKPQKKAVARPKVRKLYSKPVLAALVVAILILAKGTWGVYQKEIESRKNVAMVEKELVELEKRRDLLQVETSKLNTEEGVEEAIRRKYQVSKDGESVLVVVDKPLPAAVNDDGDGFFSKMWHSVSGIFKKDEEESE